MLASEQEIRARLSGTRLPAMPQILVKLMEQCQNEKAGMPELAKLVSQDAAMTVKVMRVAHSPTYYNRNAHKIGLEQSMMSIGLDMLRTLVISESIFQSFNGFSAAANSDLRAFWKHSLTTAIIARQAAKRLQYANANEAYLAGLLHDIGRLALLSIAPKEYAFHFYAPTDGGLCAAEQRTLQITHTEVGAMVIEQWKLDSFIADSVLYHHEPVNRITEAHPLVRIVWLAHALACRNKQSSDADIATQCGLSSDDLSAILKGVEEQIEQAAKFLDIDLSELDQVQPEPVVHAVPDTLGSEIHQFVHASELGRFFSSFQSEEKLLKAICGTACSEFQFHSVCMMLRKEGKNELVAYPISEGQQRLTGFSVSLDKPSPITEAALQNWVNTVSPEDGANGIAEEQLLRMLGSERLVCLPLVANGECVAVLIAGVTAVQAAGIESLERTLKTFRNQAATSLSNLRVKIQADQARAAQQEEQFREVTRRVAHEVNNPLAIIKNYLRVLDSKLSKQEPVSNVMSILDDELNRVGQIINDFAEQPASDKPADVNHCIQEVARLFLDTGFATAVEIEVRTYNGAAKVACQHSKLKQILVNLVKNAVEAMPQGGKVTLANHGLVTRQDKTYFGISVADNGPGIPQAVLAQLFSPITSNKNSDNRGLGLSIVHGLIKEIGGDITCRSTRDGTVFDILVPINRPEAQAANS